MRNIRLLKADEIECRISTTTASGCSLLLYKTARTDYSLLDETFGMMGWQNDYRLIDGKMYCGIAIKDNSSGEWIWKWNCGTESNTEAEKGQASDAMKRAGFCWGIGTELYSSPFIWIPRDLLLKYEQVGEKKWRVGDTFRVKKIEYNEAQDISDLVIVNQVGDVVFPTKKSFAPKEPQASLAKTPAPKPTGTIANLCIDCGSAVTMAEKSYSEKNYGYCLCRNCQKKYASK